MAEKCSGQKSAQALHTTWSLSKFPCTLNWTTAIVPAYKHQGRTDLLMEVCPTPPRPLVFWKGHHTALCLPSMYLRQHKLCLVAPKKSCCIKLLFIFFTREREDLNVIWKGSFRPALWEKPNKQEKEHEAAVFATSPCNNRCLLSVMFFSYLFLYLWQTMFPHQCVHNMVITAHPHLSLQQNM